MSVSESSLTVWEGEDVTILCSAVCSPSCNIQWKNWNGDNVGTGSLLSFVDVNKNRDGNYTCEASNKVGMRSQMSQIVVKCELPFMILINIPYLLK